LTGIEAVKPRLLCYAIQKHPCSSSATIFRTIQHGKRLTFLRTKQHSGVFLHDEYPQFYFQTLELGNWDLIDPASLPYPIIVKPVIGYSSIGVFRVENAGKWNEVKRKVRHVLAEGADMYSADVVNTNELIIEQWIDGMEYAIDAYFDSNGEPVILNVFARKFMNDGDTSDRIYYTGKHVIQEMLRPISEFLSKIGKKLDLRNFPLYAEVR
jgi:hypothetical protein